MGNPHDKNDSLTFLYDLFVRNSLQGHYYLRCARSHFHIRDRGLAGLCKTSTVKSCVVHWA
ncbi:unnamed protein product, partial [Nesidiocoris tenuis]